MTLIDVDNLIERIKKQYGEFNLHKVKRTMKFVVDLLEGAKEHIGINKESNMRFEKVSYKQYEESINADCDLTEEYNDIKLPKRATTGSAGYDFFAPFDFSLEVGGTLKIPTGIRVILDPDKFLAIYPRSSLGFKYRLQLDNVVGIIDSDYSQSDNEGHIFAKITNDGREGRRIDIKKGEAFAQGIIQQYFLTEDDNTNGVRNGGLGSTTKE